MNKKVIIGVSGGVDSAVACYLLKEQGRSVLPVFFELFEQDSEINDRLARIEEVLSLKIKRVDLRVEFNEKVIQPFLQMHRKGQTPSPCTFCNKNIKWQTLRELGTHYGISEIATGHYVNKEKHGQHYYITKGMDKLKDQSYYLWDVPAAYIKDMAFPLGVYTKSEVKALAVEKGLGFLASQKESSGVCFMHNTDFSTLYNKLYPGHLESLKDGTVVDVDGNAVGTHKGYPLYTVGQQKNITHSLEGKWAVREVDAARNRLVLDKPKKLISKNFRISNPNFIDENEILCSKDLQVKVRGLGLNPEGNARVQKIEGKIFSIETEQAAWAPCSGQPAVLYSGNRLLGGGVIHSPDYFD